MNRVKLIWLVLRLSKWDVFYLLAEAQRYRAHEDLEEHFEEGCYEIIRFIDGQVATSDFWDGNLFDTVGEALVEIRERIAGSDSHPSEIPKPDFEIDLLQGCVIVPIAPNEYYKIIPYTPPAP